MSGPLNSYVKRGDCLKLMAEIPDGSVDLVLCDPPYGITKNRWDMIPDLDFLWAELHRVAKPDAAFVMHTFQPFTTDLISSNRKNFKYLWYWDKRLKTGFLNAKKQPLRQVEEIAVFYRRQCHFAPPPSRRAKRTSATSWGLPVRTTAPPRTGR